MLNQKTPEQILKEIEQEEAGKNRGHLTIFFGYAAGVGKTCAMLKMAHKELKNGKNVLAGYVEPHLRPNTMALLDGLPILPYKEYREGTISLREFDLDAALNIHPDLILVDELAHTNAKGCRHEKRYQDVCELLDAGIDVFTTVNVQHMESLNDQVAAITGVYVRERIPDSIFDEASTVKLVDIEPEELKKRLEDGLIYRNEQAGRALSNFFTIKHLTALREIATRRCADRMNYLANRERIKSGEHYFTNEHILVCLSSAPSNARIIRTASRMAKAFGGKFTALFVETSAYASMSESNRKRLLSNTHLAKQLGAEIDTTYGDDIAFQIAEYARMNGISKIVLGRTGRKPILFYRPPTLVEKLTEYASGMDIYIIPDGNKNGSGAEKTAVLPRQVILRRDFMLIFFTSVICVLLFNFFFTPPYYTFNVADPRYPVTFSVIFIIAFSVSSLSLRLKRNEQLATQNAERTRKLLEANGQLQDAQTVEEITQTAASHLNSMLQRSIAYFRYHDGRLEDAEIFNVAEMPMAFDQREQAVALWVAEHNRRAGATTSTLPDSRYLYLAIRARQKVYGVAGIAIQDIPLSSMEYSMLLSILGEWALSLDRLAIRKEKEQEARKAESEQLKTNILRSISHDLRTPLTAISGNASNLLENISVLSEKQKMEIYQDIQEDSDWLIQLVENLLSVSRLTDGKMPLNLSVEAMDDLILEVLSHYKRNAEIQYCCEADSENLFVQVDVRLLMQVLTNLIDNALKYSGADRRVEIHCKRKAQDVIVSVVDYGCGISQEDQPYIFDMFYIGKKHGCDRSRSMGIGLSLCQSIIEAHGGTLTYREHVPRGSIFSFNIKIWEVPIHE